MKIKHVCLMTLLFLMLGYAGFAQDGSGTQHFVNAENLRKEKKYDAALIEYDKALAKEPNKVEYLFTKGQCYLEMKNNDQAVKTFEQVITAKNDYIKVHETLGKLYDEKKMYEKAVEHYDNAAKFEPDNAKKLDYKLKTIKLLNKAAKYEALGAHIIEAKQLSPENTELILLEARNNNVLGKYDEVISSMIAYIEKRGKSLPANQLAQPNYELGYAYYKKEMYDKAMPTLDKADFGAFKSRVAELRPQYQVDMATVYSKVYDYEKSEEFLTQALKVNAKFKPALELKNRIDETKKDKSKDIKKEEDSIKVEKNPNMRSEKYCKLCRMQFDAQAYDGAMASADECMRTQPKNMAIRFYKAMALYKLGNMDDAIIALDAISKRPGLEPETLALFNFALGLMYKKSQQNDIAKQYFKKAAMAMPSGSFAIAAKAEVKSLSAPGEAAEGEEAATN